jgi:hypothetical protein
VIILSGVLVVVAIALLVTGIVTGNTGHEVAGLDGLKLIYVSIGVSVISALCLAIGVFLRRKELFGSAESEASTRRSAASRSGKATRPAKAKARVGAGDDTLSTPMPSATATDVPAETSVFVVPGRKRYHLETCRQLAGRDKEELTFVEAHEEGFTACTACLPDTALAARAASTDTESIETPATEPVASEDVADTADLTRREDDDPALATRTDLPITRLDDDDLAPAAESPAAAESSISSSGTDATTETTRFDEVAETPEAAPEPPVERPSARSRSLFEPLVEDEPPAATADADTDEQHDTEDRVTAEPEPYEPEPYEPAPSEPEDTTSAATDDAEPAQWPVDTEPSSDAELTETSGTAETAEADEPEPAAEAPSADHEAAADDEPVHDDAEDKASDGEASDHEASEHDDFEPIDAGHEDASEEAASTDEAASTQDATDDSALPFVRILSGTKRYHRPDCALIEDIADDADDLETLSPAEAKERGCTPCLVCQPDKDPSDDGY